MSINNLHEEIKIFEYGKVKDLLELCIKERYFPANLDMVRDLVDKHVLKDNVRYSTSTISIDRSLTIYSNSLSDHVLKDATLEEIMLVRDFGSNDGKIELISFNKNDSPVTKYAELNESGVIVGIPFNDVQKKDLTIYALKKLSSYIRGNQLQEFSEDVNLRKSLAKYFK